MEAYMKKLGLRIGLASVVLILAIYPLSGTPVNVQTQNIALGADTSESDRGWGGGASPWDMVDGFTYYTDTWAHGLAFTGGILGWDGEPCGRRQATLNFGTMKTFNRALVWHHGSEHIPNTYSLEYWNGSSWQATGGTSSVRWDLETPPAGVSGWGAIPTEHIFPDVTGSKIRFNLNNCDITHGWIYEFEVFGVPAGLDYRLPFVGLRCITNGPTCGGQGGHSGFDEEAIDFGLPMNTPVYASERGTVLFAGTDQGRLRPFGLFIKIEHPDGKLSYYAHLSNTSPVHRGNTVQKGQLIGFSGLSGNTRNRPHLHFQINLPNDGPFMIRTLPGITWYSGDPNNPCQRVDDPNRICHRTRPGGAIPDGEAVGPPLP